MLKRPRRMIAAAVAALGLGIGSAVVATSSASAAPAAVPECTSANLAVWISPELANGAAGTIYYPLDFTNISNHTCFLVGWPGVSAVNGNLKQLGAAAVRDSFIPRRFVDVAPGGTAHATLLWEDAVVFNPGCGRVTASFLNVYAPDQRSARIAFFDNPVCTVKNHTYMRIWRIQPGVG
jgi:hypothetical protein